MFAPATIVLASLSLVSTSLAVDGYTETFANGAHGWRNGNGLSPIAVFPSGSIDGTAYGAGSAEGDTYDIGRLVPAFVGSTSYFTSGNAIFGDWRTPPVFRVEAAMRWRSSLVFSGSVTFYLRLSNSNASATAFSSSAVNVNQWRTVTFEVRPSSNLQYSPSWVSYPNVFANVTDIDIGFVNNDLIHSIPGNSEFDIDNIRFVTPCPADLDNGTGSGTPDGGVTIDDLLYYLQIYSAGTPAADLDDGSATGTRDGGVTIDDLLYFLSHFADGC